MASKRIIHSARAAQAIGPYSQAVWANGILFISGQLGIDGDTGDLRTTVEQQTDQALVNMGHILESAGLSFDHVVKTTVLLADINDFSKVNAIYAKYFQSNYPARAAYQVAALPKSGLVEIEAVAMKDSGEHNSRVLRQQDSLYQHAV